MPVTYSSYCLLLLRFSRDSLKTSERRNKNDSRSNSGSGASVSPHSEICSVAVDPNNTITALLGDDDDETPTTRLGETKSAEPTVRGRRRGVTTLAAKYTIDSISAVSNIVNMILAPMVIVPFLDYLEHGKIPRSNTAKPGSADGPTAKMGSLNSISQPIAKGWTVIFVSVR